MFCIIAFVVLAILGIFSASNRELAKEAMDCVFRRVTLRPCNTGFDEKMKAKILGSVITRSEVAARFINKHFELLSWVFFLLMLASSIWAVRGVYLYYVTGSCNGLNESAFCVFDPTGENNQVSAVNKGCPVTDDGASTALTLDGVDLKSFPALNPNASDKIVFIGCYGCDYSRKAYPMIRELVRKNDVSLTFLHYPVKEKTDYTSKVGYCAYQQDPEKFWKLTDKLFTVEKTKLEDEATIEGVVTELGLDAAKIKTCVESAQTEENVQKQLAEVRKTNFYGTPTVFINDEAFVGPKPYRVYAIRLNGLWYW
jgi:protein-disulfide isomerase